MGNNGLTVRKYLKLISFYIGHFVYIGNHEETCKRDNWYVQRHFSLYQNIANLLVAFYDIHKISERSFSYVRSMHNGS
jgi:hypothetical protein